MSSRPALIGATLLLAAFVPAGAQAATWSVSMGLPPADSRVFQNTYNSDSSSYYPSRLKVHVGDTVKLVPNGFHNAEFVRKGGKAAVLLTPQGTATDAKDAAGASFWFSGLPILGFNPALLRSGFGKSFVHSSGKTLQTGLPLADKPKPMSVRFPRTGTFSYLCTVHPGMKGQIQVKSARTRIPSRKAVAAAVRKEIAADRKDAASLNKATAPKDTVMLGSAKRDVDRFAFLPDELTVPAGTTVTFAMPAASREVHSATFGPGDPDKEPKSYIGEIAGSFSSPVFDPRGTYPSEAPGTVAAFSSTLHGNGFWNSGVLDSDAATPLARSSKVTFSTPGSYGFLCVIHPFMRGKITVK